jgi:hypothetical protein
MASKDDLAAIDFGPMDLRTLEDISTQLGACRLASEQKAGPKMSAGAQVLSVFLRVVEEKLSGFVKDLKARMVVAKP